MKTGILSLIFTLLCSFPAFSSVTKEEANQLFEVFSLAYQQEIADRDEKILFNPPMTTGDSNFDYDFLHASYYYYNKTHHINIFGGVIKLPELTIDGLASIVCHEIGHGLGGAPLKLNGMTVEGESDYFATVKCLKKVLPLYDSTYKPLDHYVEQLCLKSELCVRSFAAVRDGMLHLINMKSNLSLTLLEFDSSEVSEINREDDFYPTPECRVMTLRNGILDNPRPACWFKEED